MRISHDKESGALYIRLRDGEYDHTEDFSEGADVYLDVDRRGNVLGLEALSFEDLAQAIEERGGELEVPGLLGDQNGPPYHRGQDPDLPSGGATQAFQALAQESASAYADFLDSALSFYRQSLNAATQAALSGTQAAQQSAQAAQQVAQQTTQVANQAAQQSRQAAQQSAQETTRR